MYIFSFMHDFKPAKQMYSFFWSGDVAENIKKLETFLEGVTIDEADEWHDNVEFSERDKKKVKI